MVVPRWARATVTVTTDPQTLIAAVRDGETTDSGATTTTRDVADVVTDPYDAVEAELRDPEREGAVERTTFGGERAWLVTEANGDDAPAETQDEPVGTATRDQPTT